MPNKCCGEVLGYPCALTLSDEPLASAVEHGPVQLRVEAAQVGIPLHHFIDSEIREREAARKRAYAQRLWRESGPIDGTLSEHVDTTQYNVPLETISSVHVGLPRSAMTLESTGCARGPKGCQLSSPCKSYPETYEKMKVRKGLVSAKKDGKWDY